MSHVYLIQGFFFQPKDRLSVKADQESGEMRAFIDNTLYRNMFSGILYPEGVEMISRMSGQMTDLSGDSMLYNIIVDANRLEFTKIYNGRSDHIDYEFDRKDDIFVGGYFGDDVGSGEANCVVTEVTDDFFAPIK